MPLPHDAQPDRSADDDAALARGWSGIGFRFYDLLVVHGTYWAAWGCRWPNVYALYKDHVGPRHLEIGPGTGYFLNRLDPDVADLHLVDKFEGPLEKSRQALARFSPQAHLADSLQPLPMADDSVDSVGSGWMLHCVKGAYIGDKAPLFDNVARVLRPEGVFFGCTILPEELTGPSFSFGRWVNRRLNKSGMFSNTGDTRSDLDAELRARFDAVDVRVVGAVALWRATAR